MPSVQHPADSTIDSLDRQVLAILQEDGRATYQEISKRLGVAPATARTRVLQLLKDEVISVVAVPNPARMGYGFHANVGLCLDPGNTEAAAEMLTARGEVGWVGLTTSYYDVFFEIILKSSREFMIFKEQFLATLPGCRRIDVFEIWDTRKLHYQVIPSEEARPPAARAPNATARSRTRSAKLAPRPRTQQRAE